MLKFPPVLNLLYLATVARVLATIAQVTSCRTIAVIEYETKKMVNRLATVNTSRALKVIGIILILSFLVDVLTLSLPPKPTDNAWLIGLISDSVNRGIVPLVGLGMLLAGHWVDSFDDSSPSGIDLRFPALILSAILGFVFLIFFPLHLNSVKQVSDLRIEQIENRAEQAENQVQAQLQQVQARLNTDQAKAQIEKQKAQIKAQFTELIKDDAKYKAALERPNIPAPQKELLKRFKADPKALDAFIAEQSDPTKLAQQRQDQIRRGKEADIDAAKQSAWKNGLRVSISSLLLSIGYIIIGWTGLKSKGATSGGKKRKATAR